MMVPPYLATSPSWPCCPPTSPFLLKTSLPHAPPVLSLLCIKLQPGASSSGKPSDWAWPQHTLSVSPDATSDFLSSPRPGACVLRAGKRDYPGPLRKASCASVSSSIRGGLKHPASQILGWTLQAVAPGRHSAPKMFASSRDPVEERETRRPGKRAGGSSKLG